MPFMTTYSMKPFSFSQGSTTDPIAPSQRLLHLRNPEQCTCYLLAGAVHEYIVSHQVFSCLADLRNLLATTTAPSAIQ